MANENESRRCSSLTPLEAELLQALQGLLSATEADPRFMRGGGIPEVSMHRKACVKAAVRVVTKVMEGL